MKQVFTVMLVFGLISGHAQSIFTNVSANVATPGATIITMNGIGEIKVGMKVNELEKLTGKPVTLKNLKRKNGDRDTVDFMYKESPMQVVIGEWYGEDDKVKIVVMEVKSSGMLIKTKSGIGIGDDKLKIISTYEGFRIHIMPEYENDYLTKIKNKSSLWLHDDETGKVIVFYLTDNKVTAINVTYQEGC